MYDITPIIFMTSYPIYMISPILLSWQHNNSTWHFTHYIWHQSHCISVVTPSVLMTSQQVCKSSHLAYVLHDTHSTWNHIDNLWYQCSVFTTSQPLTLTSYPSYLCHHIHCIDDITPTVFMKSHLLYMTTSYPLYTTYSLHL